MLHFFHSLYKGNYCIQGDNMKVLHFHKDTLFMLSEFQKKQIIRLSEYLKNFSAPVIFPAYPLYVFFNDEKNIFNPKKLKAVNLQNVFYDEKDSSINIGVHTEFSDDECSILSERISRLKIAEIKKNGPLSLSEKSSAFMKLPENRINVIQVSDIIIEKNSWQLFNSKWIKLNRK